MMLRLVQLGRKGFGFDVWLNFYGVFVSRTFYVRNYDIRNLLLGLLLLKAVRNFVIRTCAI